MDSMKKATNVSQKIALVGEPLTPEEDIEYKQAFKFSDRDEDGLISAKDLSFLIRSLECNPTDDEIQYLIDHIVDEGDKLIGCSQFLTMMSILKKTHDIDTREELREIFSAIDTDHNGLIDSTELRNLMRLVLSGPDDIKLTKEEVNEMIAEIDSDKDGSLTFDDFASLFAGQT